MRLIAIVIGSIVGTIVGAVVGIAAALAFGLLEHITHPDDPSAGAGGALIGFFTVPLGILGGIPVGAFLGAKLHKNLSEHR